MARRWWGWTHPSGEGAAPFLEQKDHSVDGVPWAEEAPAKGCYSVFQRERSVSWQSRLPTSLALNSVGKVPGGASKIESETEQSAFVVVGAAEAAPPVDVPAVLFVEGSACLAALRRMVAELVSKRVGWSRPGGWTKPHGSAVQRGRSQSRRRCHSIVRLPERPHD